MHVAANGRADLFARVTPQLNWSSPYLKQLSKFLR